MPLAAGTCQPRRGRHGQGRLLPSRPRALPALAQRARR